MAVSTFVVDSGFIYILVFLFLLLFLIVFLMVYFIVRYRRSRNPVPADISGNTFLEILWVVIPTIIVMTMFVYGLQGYIFLRSAPADSMHVKVISRQWSWLFQYDNGTSSSQLVAPLGKNVRLELVSEDVIHGFFVPAFRIKQDAVPGMTTTAWFNATVAGSYDILCTQYCGVGHSAMLAKLIVVPPDQFAQWYAGEKTAAGLAPPSATPVGEELLRQKGCLACHSLDGSKMVGPTFKGLYGNGVRVLAAGKPRTVMADDDYLESSILDPGADVVVGYPNLMPSGRGKVTDKEMDDIIQYLQTLK